MKATDFDLRKDLQLNPDTGIATFRNNRLVIMDSAALGLLRNNLIEELGSAKARAFFLRLGYAGGFDDFKQMKKKYSFDSEMDLLASGPVIHSWEGIVNARPKELHLDRAKGEFRFTGVWTNSYEAEQHLSFRGAGTEPVCWSLMGYASGWCTAFMGKPMLAIEPVCVGKGDDRCEWLIQAPEAFGEVGKPYVAALAPLWGGG